jgi:hypothetical protein
MKYQQILKEFGIQDIDYTGGKARFTVAKNWTNIGKILNKAKRIVAMRKGK